MGGCAVFDVDAGCVGCAWVAGEGGYRNERVAGEDVEEGEFVRIENATRTDTEGTLVAGDDDDDEEEKGKFESDFS